jgi:hypothetical protein
MTERRRETHPQFPDPYTAAWFAATNVCAAELARVMRGHGIDMAAHPESFYELLVRLSRHMAL